MMTQPSTNESRSEVSLSSNFVSFSAELESSLFFFFLLCNFNFNTAPDEAIAFLSCLSDPILIESPSF